MGHEELPIFVRWSRFIGWLLAKTEKFPRRARFTFSSRLDNMALDIVEKIIEATYSHDKIQILKSINFDLEKMRIILRISHEQKFMSTRAYEYAIKELYETGRMLGGWIKEQQKR